MATLPQTTLTYSSLHCILFHFSCFTSHTLLTLILNQPWITTLINTFNHQLIDLCSCGFTLKLIAWVIDICPSYRITLDIYESNSYYSFCCLTALLLEIWMLKRFLEVWKKGQRFLFLCSKSCFNSW